MILQIIILYYKTLAPQHIRGFAVMRHINLLVTLKLTCGSSKTESVDPLPSSLSCCCLSLLMTIGDASLSSQPLRRKTARAARDMWILRPDREVTKVPHSASLTSTRGWKLCPSKARQTKCDRAFLWSVPRQSAACSFTWHQHRQTNHQPLHRHDTNSTIS